MHLHNLILLVTEQATENTGFVGTLGLNWKLLLAQLVNFGIILFILWKWVFGPVVKALESRRQKIEESGKKAEDIEKRVRETDLERENILKTARVEAEAISKKAAFAADLTKQEIIAVAKAEAEKTLSQAKQEIEAEKNTAIKEVKQEIANLTILATEKIIKQKLDGKRDMELINDTIKNLK